MDGKQKRLTARRALLEDLVNGGYYTREGFQSNYLITPRGQRVSRVKVMGTVMTKFVTDDENYAFIVLDDGTETIRAKFFQDLDNFNKVEEGELVKVVGKLRKYEGEIYINSEVVKKVKDPNSLTLNIAEIVKDLKELKEDKERVKELKEEHPKDWEERLADELGEERARVLLMAEKPEEGKEELEEVEEKPKEDELKEEILDLIDRLDEGEGASYQEIIDQTDSEEKQIDGVINDLLTEGTCFEPRPGRIKKL